ncbi:hypothetical protein GH714_034064 [Hevea brasiliensis]|uniref:Uncharacterized protein n=1 Tax=Hevea brasiliensis TaxID=3981 RepID=A0A6A6LLK5_HEVBR|nr:hypothetical protein GH714_034064 [Hevea brasiliensis]
MHCIDGSYLLLGPHKDLNHSEISKFFIRDADAYPRDFMDLLLSPASKVLNLNFETDVLKATLATDAVIVKMQSYLEAFDLWEVVVEDRPVAPLPPNPTLAQIKAHSEEKTKKFKAKTLIQNSVGDQSSLGSWHAKLLKNHGIG